MAKYRYAFNEDGDVVDAMNLVRVNGVVEGTYRCMGCDRVMIPKVKGDKRAKHFAHQSSEDACGKESYLHHLAKQVFFDTYTTCLATWLNCPILRESTPLLLEQSILQTPYKNYQRLLQGTVCTLLMQSCALPCDPLV